MKMEEMLREKLGKEIAQVGDEEIYVALLEIVQGLAKEKKRTRQRKSLLYFGRVFDRKIIIQQPDQSRSL